MNQYEIYTGLIHSKRSILFSILFKIISFIVYNIFGITGGKSEIGIYKNLYNYKEFYKRIYVMKNI